MNYQLKSVIVNACLTVRLTNQTGTKVGYSDPVTLSGKGHRSTNKRYAGDVRREVLYMNEDKKTSFPACGKLLP